jgi:hypothetical protein
LPVAGIGFLCAVAAFVVANPYSVLDSAKYFESLGVFSVTPPSNRKLGQANVNGILHYLWVATWGFGWLPSAMAVVGAVTMLRRNLIAALILIPGPILFVLFMGMRGGFVSRYMLPALPFLAVLAAYGLSALVGAAFAKRPRFVPAVLVLSLAIVSAQSLVHDVHVGIVHTRKNTREIALEWMSDNIPRKTKVAIEPMYLAPKEPLVAGKGARRQIMPWTLHRWPKSYAGSLDPGVIDKLERRGVCWVVVGNTQKGRALNEPERLAGANDYYIALAERGDLVRRVSPYKPGEGPVPFSFDWSVNYYPLAYERPGLDIEIYRLTEQKCA